MSMRDQYENLDKYAAYDYKDVSNAYGHGEDDAIDRVLEIIDTVNDDLDFGTKEKGVALSIKEKVLTLKGEDDGSK